MLHLTWKSFVKRGSSSSCGYHFVNQDILFSLFLLNIFLHNQYVMKDVMISLLPISLHLFCLNLESN